MQSPIFVDSQEAADIFGVDRSTITRWVQTGKLKPAGRLGRALMFDRDALEVQAR